MNTDTTKLLEWIDEYKFLNDGRHIVEVDDLREFIISLSAPQATGKEERFKMPTDKQLIDVAILFSQENNVIDKHELINMVSMVQFILDRLKENNDIMIPLKMKNKITAIGLDPSAPYSLGNSEEEINKIWFRLSKFSYENKCYMSYENFLLAISKIQESNKK